MHSMTNYHSQLERIVNRRKNWDFTGARRLYAGVDLGTYKAIVIVVDETGRPRAASMRRAEVVRSGLIVDFSGAQSMLREMITEIIQKKRKMRFQNTFQRRHSFSRSRLNDRL